MAAVSILYFAKPNFFDSYLHIHTLFQISVDYLVIPKLPHENFYPLLFFLLFFLFLLSRLSTIILQHYNYFLLNMAMVAVCGEIISKLSYVAMV